MADPSPPRDADAAAVVAGSARPAPDPFRALAASLRDSGHEAQARRLEDVLATAWTTGSEMTGELGLALRDIRRDCRGRLTPAQKALVAECRRVVRRAWPGFGRFDWLRWW